MAKITGLTNLVISNNQLSGEIPLIWNDKPDLYEVDMANNSLSGEIPSSMGTLNSLMFLILNGNKLSGEIPFSLQNCKDMDSFDLGDNRLSGNLPSWIGEMQSLLILRLRSNFFDGNIPSQVCSLSHLHILDVAHNNLSGSVPSCLGNLSGMATEISDERYEGRLSVVVKGRELIYQSTLYLVNSIDLSDNNLSGKLPEIRNLSTLGTLNLSINHFTGNIPEDIGGLSQLETLDLSRNQLSGPIPPSMISLTSLNHLNLSYNRLSGKIPTSNQFQTLNDPSIYRNNLALCGDPLPMKCPGDDKATTDSSRAGNEDHDDEFEMRWFYVTMGPGFVVGFWAVFGPLIINRSWRRAYFRFLDEMKDRVMVVITVNVARLQKKCKWERRQHGT
ncbi:Protein brassinosteroid insensitive 1 [Vitis vinifera]|uniref:Protein brassinosteroid insensitive 1 n=1 Tax=Vitis vinifera TaxID=29760 RepID=A0A438HRL3_VITVI|nr:Protein brassinosteroid insensitive 1 [Vitis vinifera]